jgi:hypothetical protein
VNIVQSTDQTDESPPVDRRTAPSSDRIGRPGVPRREPADDQIREVVSYLGSFAGPGERLPFGWDVLVMALFSLAIYFLAVPMRLPRAAIEEHIGDLTVEAEAEEAAVALPTP